MPARSPFARALGREKPQSSLNARTLAGAHPLDESSGPSAQHSPGSYRSELALKKDQHLQTSTTTDQEQAWGRGLRPASPSSATDSLTYAQGNESASPVRSALAAKDLGASLQRRTSRASMKSAFSAKALLKPQSDLSHIDQTANPVVAPSTDYIHSHGGPLHDVASDAAPQTQPSIDHLSKNTSAPPQVQGPTDGSQISELLAKLPPITHTTIEGSADQSLVRESAGNIPRRQSIRGHSREKSWREGDEILGLSDRLNLTRKVALQEDRVLPRPEASSAPKTQSSSVPGTTSSGASRRAASLTRVITALSEISAKSNQSTLRLPPLRISNNYEKLDEPDSTLQTSKSAWVRALLSRTSTMGSNETPNLTARPSQQQGRAASVIEQGKAKKMSSLQNLPGTDGENAHHIQAGTDGLETSELQSKPYENAESFSKVITNLETLLQEALSIAHGAADNDEFVNALSSDRTALLQGHDQFQGVEQGHILAPTIHSSADSSDAESKHFSSPKDHRDHTADRATYGNTNPPDVKIVEHEDDDQYRGHFKKARDATPYPGTSRKASIVPPTDGDLPVADQQGRIVVVPPSEPSITRSQTQSMNQNGLLRPVVSRDWALVKRQPTINVQGPDTIPLLPREPTATQAPLKEQRTFPARKPKTSSNAKIKARTPNQPRTSSFRLRPQKEYWASNEAYEMDKVDSQGGESEETDTKEDLKDVENLHGGNAQKALGHRPQVGPAAAEDVDTRRESTLSPLPDTRFDLQDQGPTKQGSIRKGRRSHFSIKEPHGFSLSRSHRRAPIARDWSTSRKRWTAAIACLSTALIGLIIGIYAGEVPAIQYAIVDEHHYTILGNVVFFIGLAITTVLFFPLPVLHGRKPYTLAALAILMPLQFPQALAVNTQRSPSVATYRVGLLLPRAIAGLIMGFANINFLATLLDLFGASLQSSNPHQELVDVNDVRRHGGGMGMWLGLWTWCYIGSIGVGFFIGAVIVSGLDVSWGFWITIILTAAVLILNVLVPEVRRSAYRRSLAEVRNGGEVSRRIARGEMKMHLDATGPIYWWEEVTAGLRLCARMLKQPGFVVLSLYLGWIYGQIVLVIVVSGQSLRSMAGLTPLQLLGALTSKYYHFRPQYVGLCVAAIPIGALLATPFQKASVLSRSRTHKPRTDSMTFEKRVARSSHLVRRTVFMILLPFADLAYTLSSGGAHIHYMVPTVFAGTIGFLSNLAIAECNGIIMETYDTSDLQAGMTGRPRRVLPDELASKRTNFSCFPRVTAAFAISQAVAYLIAAAGTGTGGAIERRLGAQTATAVVAGILLVLTLLLIAILTRFKTVQIIPTQRYGTAVLSGPENEWKP